MTIQASDSRGMTALANVNIEILRNPSDTDPVFINFDFNLNMYTENILFNHIVNTTVSTKPLVSDVDVQVSASLCHFLHYNTVKYPHVCTDIYCQFIVKVKILIYIHSQFYLIVSFSNS